MKPTYCFAVSLALIVTAHSARAEPLTHDLRGNVERQMASLLRQTVARSLPTIAATAGLRYSYDPVSGAFDRERELNGLILVDIPETLPKDEWTLDVSYQDVDFSTFEGKDLHGLHDDVPIHYPRTSSTFVIPHFGIGLKTHVVSTLFTYGIRDGLEFNLIVPVLDTHFAENYVDREVNLNAVGTKFVSGDRFGPGDIAARWKWQVLKSRHLLASLGLGIRLPS